jgi:Beta-propeller repeat
MNARQLLQALAVVVFATLIFAGRLPAPVSGPKPVAGPTNQGPKAQSGVAKPSSGPSQGRLIEAYGKLPLSFEANQGQTDSRVKFLSRGAGYSLFLTGDEAVLTLRKANVAQGSSSSPAAFRRYLRPSARDHIENNIEKPQGHKADPALHGLQTIKESGPRAKGKGRRTNGAVLRMRLVGANPNAPVKGVDGLPVKSNYFIGNDPKKWRTNVANYARVAYEGVYPGVDLVYYSNQGQLEYDFVVAPGADPRVIRLDVGAVGEPPRAHGHAPLRIAVNGDLVVKIDGGEVRLHQPVVYQPSRTPKPESRTPIQGRYRLTKRSEISFEVGSYDRTKPLVIDPALSYSTYLGGSGGESGQGIAVDSAGNAYVTGGTESTDFPTVNPLQPTLDGYGDAFVIKLNATGSALVYSTYLGGSSGESGQGIAVDSAGNAYVSGVTESTDFPTTPGAFQTTCGGGCAVGSQHAFVTKLNVAGSALVYSTYLGGTGFEGASSIALDASGNAYVTGGTSSNDFPITPGAFQTECGGGSCYDGFVTKLNASGSALLYSTYLGGSGNDYGHGIAVDSAGNAYVTGATQSTDFPTMSPLQASLDGGGSAFVTKINPTGSALVYSTYLGGSGAANGSGIAVDSAGNAYVTGGAGSGFPLMNPLQASNGGGASIMASALSSAF